MCGRVSGFVETPGGRRLIFSFLSNNQGGKNHEASDALDGLCLAMIEEFDRKPTAGGRAVSARIDSMKEERIVTVFGSSRAAGERCGVRGGARTWPDAGS